MPIRNPEDLLCWRLANELKLEVLAFTGRLPAKRDFKFCDQIRSCCASATANIAEGFGRFRPGEFAQYLSWARGSLFEAIDRLGDARDREFIDHRTHDRLVALARSAVRLTTNLMLQKRRQAAEERRTDRERRRRPRP